MDITEELLSFQVNKQELVYLNPTNLLAANSIGYLHFEVDFSADWANLYKVAVFERAGQIYAMNVDEDDADNGYFTVPWQAIKTPGFNISFFATNTRIYLGLDGTTTQIAEVSKRVTTNPVQVKIRVSTPMRGVVPEQNSRDLNVIEISNLALQIAKEAYALSWNTQEALKEMSSMLGGNPYELAYLEENLKNILASTSNKQIQIDEYGNYIINGDGDFVFEEVEDG